MGEVKGVYRILVGRPEGTRSLGGPRHRRKDNIKMDLRKKGIDDANYIQLAQDSPMSSFCGHCNEPWGSIKKAGYSLVS
jgi:hypothetical protein